MRIAQSNGPGNKKVIVDTAAHRTVIKNSFLNTLPESVQTTLRASETVFVVGDGAMIQSRGTLLAEIALGTEKHELPVEVIDSTADWDILLGRNSLQKFEAILQITQGGKTQVWLPTPAIQKILDETPQVQEVSMRFRKKEALHEETAESEKAYTSILYPMCKGEQWELEDASDIPTLPPEEPFERSSSRGGDQPSLQQILLRKLEHGAKMSSEELARIRGIFARHEKAFALTLEDLGTGYTGTAFSIELKSGMSGPRCNPYSASHTDEIFLKGVIDDLLKHGIIVRSKSRYSSPALIARSTGREPRFCVAYNQLNTRIEWDSYPLPTVEEVIRSVAEFKYFVKFDLKKGYWQIRIDDPKTRELMAFICKFGVFEWHRLPFGISTGPGFFQRIADQICIDVDPVHLKAYLDDIVIGADSIAELATLLEKTLTYIEASGLKLHPEKCEFFQEEIDLLGHHISGAGITPQSRILDRLRLKERPKNPGEVRAFLGLAGYYQKFIKNFA